MYFYRTCTFNIIAFFVTFNDSDKKLYITSRKSHIEFYHIYLIRIFKFSAFSLYHIVYLFLYFNHSKNHTVMCFPTYKTNKSFLFKGNVDSTEKVKIDFHLL